MFKSLVRLIALSVAAGVFCAAQNFSSQAIGRPDERLSEEAFMSQQDLKGATKAAYRWLDKSNESWAMAWKDKLKQRNLYDASNVNLTLPQLGVVHPLPIAGCFISFKNLMAGGADLKTHPLNLLSGLGESATMPILDDENKLQRTINLYKRREEWTVAGESLAENAAAPSPLWTARKVFVTTKEISGEEQYAYVAVPELRRYYLAVRRSGQYLFAPTVQYPEVKRREGKPLTTADLVDSLKKVAAEMSDDGKRKPNTPG
jgi:hypothetical protein